jgi:hypothetical protein
MQFITFILWKCMLLYGATSYPCYVSTASQKSGDKVPHMLPKRQYVRVEAKMEEFLVLLETYNWILGDFPVLINERQGR